MFEDISYIPTLDRESLGLHIFFCTSMIIWARGVLFFIIIIFYFLNEVVVPIQPPWYGFRLYFYKGTYTSISSSPSGMGINSIILV